MTYKISILLAVIFFVACRSATPLSISIDHPQISLSDSDNIAILQPYDSTFVSPAFFVGTVNTFYHKKKIGFDSILASYLTIARKNGANIIRLTNIRYGKSKNESDGAMAQLFRVEDIRNYEKRILWTPYRKLVWEDFKGNIPDSLIENNQYSSFANIGIQHRSNASFLVGSNHFFVLSMFDCTKSWYRPYAYYQNNFLLFQQGLFDLTELYARKMKQQLSTKKVKDKLDFAAKVDRDMSTQYRAAETQFVQDTKGGSNKEALEKWHQKIWNELTKK